MEEENRTCPRCKGQGKEMVELTFVMAANPVSRKLPLTCALCSGSGRVTLQEAADWLLQGNRVSQ